MCLGAHRQERGGNFSADRTRQEVPSRCARRLGNQLESAGEGATYVDKAKQLTLQLDFWAVREATVRAKQRDVLAGYDHQQIELELPLDVLPAPGPWR